MEGKNVVTIGIPLQHPDLITVLDMLAVAHGNLEIVQIRSYTNARRYSA